MLTVALLLILGSALGGCATGQAVSSAVKTYEEERISVPATPGADSTSKVSADTGSALAQVILMLPLRDLSKHEGETWDIPSGIPSLFEDSLQVNPFYRMIPIERSFSQLTEEEREGNIDPNRAVQIARSLNVDWVVLGEIEEFTMKRFRATVPLGGYRQYQGVAAVRLVLINAVDGRRGGEIIAEGTVDNRRTGITNPADYVPLDKQYYFFGDIEWGTPAFHESLIGLALAACGSKVARGMADHIKPPPELVVSEPKIIDIDGDRVYINVGLEHGIRNSDKYGVWDNGRDLRDPVTGNFLGHALPRRVGVIQVDQVLSDNLSSARILEGQGDIERSFRIRAE